MDEEMRAAVGHGCCARHVALGHTDGRHGALSMDDLGTMTEVANEGLAAADPGTYAGGALRAVLVLCATLSAREPQLWTEAHRREALRRTYEIAAELASEGRASDASWLCMGAAGYAETLTLWVGDLSNAGDGPRFDAARIDREVARVQALAEGRLVRSSRRVVRFLDRESPYVHWEGDEDADVSPEDRGRYRVVFVRVTRIRRAVP